jgi:hypothetical protein
MAILKDLLFTKGVGLSISILEGDEGLIFRHNQPVSVNFIIVSRQLLFFYADSVTFSRMGHFLRFPFRISVPFPSCVLCSAL